MKRSVATTAVVKFVSSLAAVALLLFVPAGTFHYFNGWLFLALLFIPMALFGLFLIIEHPALLARRLEAKEEQGGQKWVAHLGALLFVAGFLSAGFDERYRWTTVPVWVVCLASALFLAGYGLFAVVMMQNEYLSRTIKVESAQTVIDTGLYRFVRHPMYGASTIMFLALPLVLGSLVSFVIFLSYPLLMVKRIAGEEEVLERELGGYTAYKARVRYRLIPWIW